MLRLYAFNYRFGNLIQICTYVEFVLQVRIFAMCNLQCLVTQDWSTQQLETLAEHSRIIIVSVT